MAQESTRPLEDMSFGDALAELEDIVGSLEGGQLELEDSIGRYERGVTVLKALQARLADAQQRVTVLIGELEAETEAAPGLTEEAEE